MKFALDAIYIEDACRETSLAQRILRRADGLTSICFVADGDVIRRVGNRLSHKRLLQELTQRLLFAQGEAERVGKKDQ